MRDGVYFRNNLIDGVFLRFIQRLVHDFQQQAGNEVDTKSDDTLERHYDAFKCVYECICIIEQY